MSNPSQLKTGTSGPWPSNRRTLRNWLARTVFAVYLAVLTALLLMQDPVSSDPTGILNASLAVPNPVAHLLSFWILAVLAFASRPPARGWVVILLLCVYATGTELLQGFVPGRTPEWTDWFQDLAGVALGAVCFAAVLVYGESTE